MDDGNDAIERKGLVTLEVEHWSQGLRECQGGAVRAERCRIRNRRRVRATTASGECRCRRDYQDTTHGSGKREAGSGKREAGSGKREEGSGKREEGSGKREAGRGKRGSGEAG